MRRVRACGAALGVAVAALVWLAVAWSEPPVLEGLKAPLPVTLWRELRWPVLIQGLVIFATVTAIVALVRERVMR